MMEYDEAKMVAAVGSLFAGAVLFGAGYAIWENIAENLYYFALASSLICYVAAFVVICLGLGASKYARTAAIAGLLLAFATQSANYLFFKVPYYDSDALLFNAYSAQLLTQGVDPYTASMEPGYKVFGVPEGEATPTVSGGTVFSLSYPALSFLIYLPFILFGITNLLWVNVIGHLAILIMLIAAAPYKFKPIAPLALFIDPSYFTYTIGGVTDVLWVPCAMLAAMWWNRRIIPSAIALGVACCFKQTPWLLIPFALTFWGHNAWALKRREVLLTPMLALFGTFFIINLPFMLWHPLSWLHGVLTPISGQLVLFGSGTVQLVSSGLVSASPVVLSVISLGVLGILLALYALFPGRFTFLPFIAPGISYFFAPRSLQNYFMYWPLVLLAYVFANWEHDRAVARLESITGVKVYAAGLSVLLVALFAGALAIRSHRVLAVSIVHAWVNPVTDGVDKLRLHVQNLSATPQLVHFNITEQGDGYDYQQWLPKTPQLLAPHTASDVVIRAPSPDYEVDLDGTTATQAIAVANGRQEYSRAVNFHDVPPKLQNAQLRTWSYGEPAYPIAWHFNLDDVKTGHVTRAILGGRYVVRLSLPPDKHHAWFATTIDQLTDARSGTLRFFLRPEADYEGDAQPREFFGAELRDVLGHEIYVTIDSRRHKRAFFRSRSRLIIVEPGKLHHWNALDVDLAQAHDRFGFALSPTATMLVSVVAIAHGPVPQAVTGFFGGVAAWTASPALVSISQ